MRAGGVAVVVLVCEAGELAGGRQAQHQAGAGARGAEEAQAGLGVQVAAHELGQTGQRQVCDVVVCGADPR